MSLAGKVKVMVVDDSAVVRGMISKALQESSEIEVIASAHNGLMAMQELKRKAADVILLDVEMPEMDGLTALPKLLEISPNSKIIMVSSLTGKGADIAVRAMELGATDSIGKPSSQFGSSQSGVFYAQLREKVITLGRKGRVIPVTSGVAVAEVKKALKPLPFHLIAHLRCLAIGSSTGGPQALMQIFRSLKGVSLRVPVFITQHMPPNFTTILASHLKEASGMPCEEGKDGEEVKAGTIYVAPGDYHLLPYREEQKIKIRLTQDPPVNFCRPAVDPMFKALADIYGPNLLGVVLTGMGQDGFDGAKTIKAKNGRILIQDRESCVVWGMPKAISDAGIADAEVPLNDIGGLLRGILR